MRKTEFLQELTEALQGEVSAAALRENVNYYDQYISQETAKGRSEEDVIGEIGSPRLIARTIIDSSEAGGGNDSGSGNSGYGGSGSGYDGGSSGSSGNYGGYDAQERGTGFHYIDLNKWYWKVLLLVIVVAVICTVFSIVGGIFTLLIRYAWPIFVIWLIYSVIRGMRR